MTVKQCAPCVWCELSHPTDYLCEPAGAVLGAIIADKQRNDIPTEMYDQPRIEGVPGDTVLCSQLVVKGALVDVAGVRRAAVMFTGRDVAGAQLPTWLYAGADADVQRIGEVTQTMTSGAVRARRRERSR